MVLSYYSTISHHTLDRDKAALQCMMFFAMEQIRVTWMISWRMFNIQCEDNEVLRFSNTNGVFWSPKTSPTAQTADINKILVTAELPWAQLVSQRPTTASLPWSSPQNNMFLTLLQRNQYSLSKVNKKNQQPEQQHLGSHLANPSSPHSGEPWRGEAVTYPNAPYLVVDGRTPV